jgi:succinate dehydrogenase hydrophobic anchor subunit
MMRFDAFVSYPHQNKAAADAACAALETAGIRCWIAPRDVEPGAEWASAIVDAIDSCRVMVLVFSSHANDSKQIRREVQRAFDREVPVLPLRIENVAPEKSLAYFMGPVHWLDALTPPLEQHLQRLVVSARALVRSADTPADRTTGSRFDAGDDSPVTDQTRVERPGVDKIRVEDRSVVAPEPQPAPEMDLDMSASSTLSPSPPQQAGETPNTVNGAVEAVAASIAVPVRHEPASAGRVVLDHVTAIFIWLGTIVLVWWLTAASLGPGSFAQAVWVTHSPVGWLLLACYVFSVFLQSVNRAVHVMQSVRIGQHKPEQLRMKYEDVALVANLPLVIVFAVIMAMMVGRNHAAVVFGFGSPTVSLPMLLFALTVSIQMRSCAQTIIDHHSQDSIRRYGLGTAATVLAAAAAIAMVYAIARISFAP